MTTRMRDLLYSEERGEFICVVCNEGEGALFQHPDDEHHLVCACCGERYETPEEGPWTFTLPPGPEAGNPPNHAEPASESTP